MPKKERSLKTDRLVTLRKARGYTQDEMAAHIGMARSSYAGYEAGVSEPPLKTMARISEVLGTTTDYLLGSSDDPGPFWTVVTVDVPAWVPRRVGLE